MSIAWPKPRSASLQRDAVQPTRSKRIAGPTMLEMVALDWLLSWLSREVLGDPWTWLYRLVWLPALLPFDIVCICLVIGVYVGQSEIKRYFKHSKRWVVMASGLPTHLWVIWAIGRW